MTTDAELLRRHAEGGDEAAFGELVRRQMDFVYSVAWRVTASGALAQDVAQSVFLQLARSAPALAHYDKISGKWYISMK
jgi:DNA-directed RNA polymerase specialized sigma24 family protein